LEEEDKELRTRGQRMAMEELQGLRIFIACFVGMGGRYNTFIKNWLL